MGESTTTITPMLCRRCGQVARDTSSICPHCGSPLAAVAGPVAGGQVLEPASGLATVPARRADLPSAGWPASRVVLAPAAGVPVHRFEPARIGSGPRLSRRGWLAVGASSAVTVLAVAAFLVLRPAPTTPADAVRGYFAYLGQGDTAAALALVNTGGQDISSDWAPLLVPAALASVENRPTGAAVTSSRTDVDGEGGEVTTVAVTYTVGGQPVGQEFTVVATEDKEMPYRLEWPFLVLNVQAPHGLAATVNGIAVDADRLAQGTPAFPGAYQATTIGNALFAGATQAATYRIGDRVVMADIEFGQPALAPGAPQTVQAMAQQLLDTNCVNPPIDSYGYQCPLQAPYWSYDQTTTWKITTYPQVQLYPPVPGQTLVQFGTVTPGSADYTITYTDFDGSTHTEADTVPIDIGGYAGIGDDGAIQIALN